MNALRKEATLCIDTCHPRGLRLGQSMMIDIGSNDTLRSVSPSGAYSLVIAIKKDELNMPQAFYGKKEYNTTQHNTSKFIFPTIP